MNELVFQPHRNSLILRSRPHPSESTFHGRDPLRLCLLQPRGVLPEPYRMTHRVSNRGTDQCGYWTVGPFNTCLAPYLYTFGLWVIGAALHGDLEQAVLEVGAYPVPVYTFRQVHAPSEVPVVAFSGVVTHVLRFAPALPVDDQNAAGEGDLDVILFHAGEFATYHEIVTLGEYVGRRDPGGRVGPALVFRSATLGVLTHPGHLAHVVHEPPKWVACPAHLPSFCGRSVGIGSTPVASAGLRGFQILRYRRTYPAYRTPGNEDRLALYLARFVRVSE